MCIYFLLLFDVVFIIFESSLSRKILQSNLDFFDAIFPHWMFFGLKSSSSWNIYLSPRIFEYYVRWLYAALSTSVVTFLKVLSERWISLFSVGILLLPSIQLLSKLIRPLNFSVQERIDWELTALFYFLLYFGGYYMDSRKTKSIFKSSFDSGLTRQLCSSNNTETAISSIMIIWVSLPSLHFLMGYCIEDILLLFVL